MYEDLGSSPCTEPLMAWAARRVNEAGIELIKEYEGLRLKAYQCAGKVWTIGYGHTRTVFPFMEVSLVEAQQLLIDDLRIVEKALSRLVRVPLGDNQFAALASFVFNVGIRNFEQSTLLTLLNRGWYEQVPAQFMRWNKVRGEVMGGLSRRRGAEARLWNKLDEGEDDIIRFI